MMTSSSRTTLSIIMLSLVLYLATPTFDYYWDGITFALQIEKVASGERSASLLFHQNHLLYNAVGYLMYRAAQALGLGLRALNLLQIANAVVGALSVAVFFRIAERVTRSQRHAIGCSAALAMSAAWWRSSTDADAYALAILLMLVSASNLLGEKPRWYLAGLALGGAMLIHEIAALFYPAALTALFTSAQIRRKLTFAARMSAAAWIVTISSYWLCASLLHRIHSPLDLIRWATSNPSQKQLSSPLDGLAVFLKTNFDAIVGHNVALFFRSTRWFETAVAAAALIAAVACVLLIKIRKVDLRAAIISMNQWDSDMSEARNRITLVLAVWAGVFSVILLMWGPLILFRAFYVPALFLGVALILSNYHRVSRRRASAAAAVLGVAALGLSNLAFYILPNMRADSNPLISAARETARIWNNRTVVYFAGRNESDTAFEYFNPGTEWRRLTSAVLADLDSEIDRLGDEGRDVWFNNGAAESVDPAWLVQRASRTVIEISLPNAPVRYLRLCPSGNRLPHVRMQATALPPVRLLTGGL